MNDKIVELTPAQDELTTLIEKKLEIVRPEAISSMLAASVAQQSHELSQKEN